MARWYLQATATFLVSFNILLVLSIIFKISENNECPLKKAFKLQSERIVGGYKAPKYKFRFMAALVIVRGYTDLALQCGASIISSYWVVCAAHCIELIKNARIKTRDVNVFAGHAEWKKAALSNDSSLIRVKEPFDKRFETPITLAKSNTFYKANSTAIVIGWGRNDTESEVVQDTLYAVNVHIFDQSYCSDLYGEGAITVDMFCAGSYVGGKDACQFDSGGPIIQGNTLIGIISWGGECGERTQPGVYAKMTYFIPWIKQIEKLERASILCGARCPKMKKTKIKW